MDITLYSKKNPGCLGHSPQRKRPILRTAAKLNYCQYMCGPELPFLRI